MRIKIICVGRLKDSPERDMVNDYVSRAIKTGRQFGIRSVEEIEVDAGGGKEKEAERILAKAGSARLILLDERGKTLKSKEFSTTLANWRDSGEDIAFCIGGADGLAPELLQKTQHKISFGIQTWPHKLVRVMIAEQIYRALSIEAGTPYHRE
jgi:23S rRNA (pseudouridine1915-N3)-methyltransferase